jgi:RimJ/RimL family protein N-acetyltransferase
MKNYLFTSQRLGFRNWQTEDLQEFAALNADPEVMEHFPKTLTTKETGMLIERFQQCYETRGYAYFATELQETGELIGFIGLLYQEYEAVFCPATDIGWRLKKSAWGNGYATEGAKRCLEYAFSELNLSRIISTCTVDNARSEHVMKKIGMSKQGAFKHPKLKAYPEYEQCVWYAIGKK